MPIVLSETIHTWPLSKVHPLRKRSVTPSSLRTTQVSAWTLQCWSHMVNPGATLLHRQALSCRTPLSVVMSTIHCHKWVHFVIDSLHHDPLMIHRVGLGVWATTSWPLRPPIAMTMRWTSSTTSWLLVFHLSLWFSQYVKNCNDCHASHDHRLLASPTRQNHKTLLFCDAIYAHRKLLVCTHIIYCNKHESDALLF